MKRRTVILPLNLPVLTDKGAAQVLDTLQQLIIAIEHQYAEQIHRYRRRERTRRHRTEPRQAQLLASDDPPF